MRKTPLLLLTCIALLAFSGQASAYTKCRTPEGKIVFSDTGCNGAELVDRKASKTTPHYSNNQQIKSIRMESGCSEPEKRLAYSHFDKAEEINNERANRYDERKDRNRRYKHEMDVGKSILAACSGVQMPQDEAKQSNHQNCTVSSQHYGGSTQSQMICN